METSFSTNRAATASVLAELFKMDACFPDQSFNNLFVLTSVVNSFDILNSV